MPANNLFQSAMVPQMPIACSFPKKSRGGHLRPGCRGSHPTNGNLNAKKVLQTRRGRQLFTGSGSGAACWDSAPPERRL